MNLLNKHPGHSKLKQLKQNNHSSAQWPSVTALSSYSIWPVLLLIQSYTLRMVVIFNAVYNKNVMLCNLQVNKMVFFRTEIASDEVALERVLK